MGSRTGDGRTTIERSSERALRVTRTFDAPVRLVYDAWTRPELFKLWWAPRSRNMPLVSCEMDVRTGGSYRIVFQLEGGRTMAFFGRYLDVSPLSRLVWTNDESGEDAAVTTVTFADVDGRTRLVLEELYPTPDALDESFIGMEGGMPEQFDQLDELLAARGPG